MNVQPKPADLDHPVTSRVRVPATLAGERIDRAIAELAPTLSRRRARDILLRGGVWIGGKRVRSQNQPVVANDELTIIHPPAFQYPQITITDEDILWEDDWFVAIRKAPGWYVQMTPWDVFGNVEHAVNEFMRTKRNHHTPIHLVHRLDRDTSGVLLVSRNPVVNAPIQKLWGEGKVEKIYIALVAGAPPDSWQSDEPLGPGPNARYRVDPIAGKPALTLFQTRRRAGGIAEIEARPKTGRTHQIRIHAAHTGHPLLGDARYGGPMQVDDHPVERIMLHAESLAFRHPRTGANLKLQAEPPADYQHNREVLFKNQDG
jgi:RluA family pseudouridine synthase